MRDCYIPDLTERFPEGFDGVDMTPSFFGEQVDWSRALGYEPSYEELIEEDSIPFPRETPLTKHFEIGDKRTQYGFYGGVTTYTVNEIDRENGRILLGEEWCDVDGTGTRPAEWHKLVVNDIGNEMALEWTSEEFGDVWIFA